MWHRPAICNGGRHLHCFLTSPIGGVAVGGSLRSSLSGSRPTSHSQGHGRPCLPRPHLRRTLLKRGLRRKRVNRACGTWLKRQRLPGIPGGAAFNYNPVGNRYLGISRTRTLAGAWAALRVISNLYLYPDFNSRSLSR